MHRFARGERVLYRLVAPAAAIIVASCSLPSGRGTASPPRYRPTRSSNSGSWRVEPPPRRTPSTRAASRWGMPPMPVGPSAPSTFRPGARSCCRSRKAPRAATPMTSTTPASSWARSGSRESRSHAAGPRPLRRRNCWSCSRERTKAGRAPSTTAAPLPGLSPRTNGSSSGSPDGSIEDMNPTVRESYEPTQINDDGMFAGNAEELEAALSLDGRGRASSSWGRSGG